MPRLASVLWWAGWGSATLVGVQVLALVLGWSLGTITMLALVVVSVSSFTLGACVACAILIHEDKEEPHGET